METLIKLNNQTAGRDKLARLLQYVSRLVWHRLQQSNKNGVQSLKKLEFQLSTFRKLLRLGRCIESLYATLALQHHPDTTVRVTLTVSKIANALFLFCDHMLWLGRADMCNVDTDKWSSLSNKYWLYSITMNLLRDFYEIGQILKSDGYRILNKDGCKNINDVFQVGVRALACVNESPDVLVDTLKNCCDFFIPLTALGYARLSPGTVGFLGAVSSVAGLIALIKPGTKLTPA